MLFGRARRHHRFSSPWTAGWSPSSLRSGLRTRQDSWSPASWTLPGPSTWVRRCAISIRRCGPIIPLLVLPGPRQVPRVRSQHRLRLLRLPLCSLPGSLRWFCRLPCGHLLLIPGFLLSRLEVRRPWFLALLPCQLPRQSPFLVVVVPLPAPAIGSPRGVLRRSFRLRFRSRVLSLLGLCPWLLARARSVPCTMWRWQSARPRSSGRAASAAVSRSGDALLPPMPCHLWAILVPSVR